MNCPKVAIIVPAYNTARYIAECLISCINQTLKEIEIIVVDDCSPDNAMVIAEEFVYRKHRLLTCALFAHELNNF